MVLSPSCVQGQQQRAFGVGMSQLCTWLFGSAKPFVMGSGPALRHKRVHLSNGLRVSTSFINFLWSQNLVGRVSDRSSDCWVFADSLIITLAAQLRCAAVLPGMRWLTAKHGCKCALR